MSRNFSSGNTPENIREERYWQLLVDRLAGPDKKKLELRDQLPSHYRNISNDDGSPQE